jgi:hypothetical protein
MENIAVNFPIFFLSEAECAEKSGVEIATTHIPPARPEMSGGAEKSNQCGQRVPFFSVHLATIVDLSVTMAAVPTIKLGSGSLMPQVILPVTHP